MTPENNEDEARFAFGENWKRFLATVDHRRVDRAIATLRESLKLDATAELPLADQSFLDIGCGSGLFSLAASRLGATVTSIDFDPQCIECTHELKSRFADANSTWVVRRGDVLDESMMRTIGQHDVVYSWGVLHHTGQMESAIAMASRSVVDGGIFCIAIYNDQGGASRRWLTIKRCYAVLPEPLRPLWVVTIAGVYEIKFALARLLSGRSPLPFADWRAKRDDRGMSVWHDWVDWIGGLPFEVATPQRIIQPLIDRGFKLIQLKTLTSGWGCNEYTFSKT